MTGISPLPGWRFCSDSPCPTISTKPVFGSPDSSAEMRAQFVGLKQLIDTVPTITAAVVDSVSTLNPGDPATVTAMASRRGRARIAGM